MQRTEEIKKLEDELVLWEEYSNEVKEDNLRRSRDLPEGFAIIERRRSFGDYMDWKLSKLKSLTKRL